MNKKDKARIARLRNLLCAIPFAVSGGGTKSASAVGFVSFDSDMRRLLPAVSAVLYGMQCEGYDRLYEWEKGIDYEDPDQLLEKIEQWIDLRQQEGWESSTRPIEYPMRSE